LPTAQIGSGTILSLWKEVPWVVGMTLFKAYSFLPTIAFFSSLLWHIPTSSKHLLLTNIHVKRAGKQLEVNAGSTQQGEM
jgi:hypothetical protein